VEYYSLIIKFFAGEISDNELTRLKSWLELNPENRRIFDEENELWQEASIQTKFENYKNDSAWLNISCKLGLGKSMVNSVTLLRKNYFRILIAAATIAFLMAIGGVGLWIVSKNSFHQINTGSTIVETKEGEKARIILSDSSEVILNSDSRVQYGGNYNLTERRVKLSGEAFFDISTNPEKPFVVQLDNMSISATGTRFNVFSFKNENRVETTLEEGVLQVSVKGKENINVRAGQQAVYFVSSGEIIVRDVNTDTYTSWKENKLRFHDTSFEEVLRGIGRKYNVTFEVSNRELFDLKYTATFIDESIEDVMQMLKTVSPITYKIYYRTSVNDKRYQKPRIVVGKRKSNI
jgi:ferric-dicitrate binding protein FerR (iron transport regulator)